MNEQNFNSQAPASLIKLIKQANMVEEFGERVPQLEAGSTKITYVMVLEWMQIVRNEKNKIRGETLGYSLLRGCRSLTYHIVIVEETDLGHLDPHIPELLDLPANFFDDLSSIDMYFSLFD